MADIRSEKGKLVWSKPELRRIDAGSAEASANNGTPDGGDPNGTPPRDSS